MVTRIPEGAKYVMESSSVWYGTFRYMRDGMGCDMTLSNPFNTKIIATSLKKTDRVDAFQLANMLRGGYIAVSRAFRGDNENKGGCKVQKEAGRREDLL